MEKYLVTKISIEEAKDPKVYNENVDRSITMLQERLGVYKGNVHKFKAEQTKSEDGLLLTVRKRGNREVGRFYTELKGSDIAFWISWESTRKNKRNKDRANNSAKRV